MSGVLVVLEQRASAWNRMSFEALAAGQQLAATLGTTCSAAVMGSDIASLAAELTDKQLEKVILLDHPLLADYTSDGYVTALEQLVKQTAPAYVVFPHTYQVRDFAPALATRFRRVLISDVVAFHAKDSGSPVFVRQLLQGKLNADYKQSAHAPTFVSVQAGTFRADALVCGSAPSRPSPPPSMPPRSATSPASVSANPPAPSTSPPLPSSSP